MTAPATQDQQERLHRSGWPVIEIFGPTAQGEGPAAGRPCYFVRFGGCDYRCSWCDSMYAVDPAEVREHATRMTAPEIAMAIKALPPGPEIVVLSGGNPALHPLKGLVVELQKGRLHCHVETQGSVWKPWLAEVAQLVVSPKPPSSGMDTPRHRQQFATFMESLYASYLPAKAAALKVVVFDEADYLWAEAIHVAYPEMSFYLSVGTPTDILHNELAVHKEIRDRYAWLCERAAGEVTMCDVVLLPQLHVIAHGTKRGV